MNDVIFVVLMWVALGIAFVCGCLWNSGSYDRGYEDGHREGFNRALGKDRK